MLFVTFGTLNREIMYDQNDILIKNLLAQCNICGLCTNCFEIGSPDKVEIYLFGRYQV